MKTGQVKEGVRQEAPRHPLHCPTLSYSVDEEMR